MSMHIIHTLHAGGHGMRVTDLRVLLALSTLPLLSVLVLVGVVDSSVHGDLQQLQVVLDTGLDELLLVHVLHGAVDLMKRG